jgi:DNA anti-recombination protein RmuC
MDIKEAVMEALRTLIIPELNTIKERISVIEARLDEIDKRFEDMRADMNSRFEDMRADMNSRFEDMRADMNSRFEDMRADMNSRFEDMRADMNSRFEDVDKRFDEMRADMNKRFEEHFNFNMKRFDSLEAQIHVLLAEVRELRGLYQKKVDIDSFRELENKYLELLKEVTVLKQKTAT